VPGVPGCLVQECALVEDNRAEDMDVRSFAVLPIPGVPFLDGMSHDLEIMLLVEPDLDLPVSSQCIKGLIERAVSLEDFFHGGGLVSGYETDEERKVFRDHVSDSFRHRF
jgi:hypothetical protein